jgi:hypothetical protein
LFSFGFIGCCFEFCSVELVLMFRIGSFILVAFLMFISCTEKANQLEISEDGFQFRLIQRKEIEVPSELGGVVCSIDDITAGQTILTIKSNEKIIFEKSIEEGEKFVFQLDGASYQIQCTDLVNKLIGNDFGFFVISHYKIMSSPKDETALIEDLLMKIETSNVQFIRNGKFYNAKEASEHLRSKWQKSKIKTFELFIDQIASKSSISNKPYLIKLEDGTVVEAEDWYADYLVK